MKLQENNNNRRNDRRKERNGFACRNKRHVSLQLDYINSFNRSFARSPRGQTASLSRSHIPTPRSKLPFKGIYKPARSIDRSHTYLVRIQAGRTRRTSRAAREREEARVFLRERHPRSFLPPWPLQLALALSISPSSCAAAVAVLHKSLKFNHGDWLGGSG